MRRNFIITKLLNDQTFVFFDHIKRTKNRKTVNRPSVALYHPDSFDNSTKLYNYSISLYML